MAKGKQQRISTKKRAELLFLVVILAIPTVHWLVFWLSVNASSFVYAFQTPRGAWTLQNFADFWDSLRSPYGDTIGLAVTNTLKYFAVGLLVIFPLSILIAYFIFKRVRGYKIFRVVFFLPAIISSVVLIGAYSSAIRPNGLLDAVLGLFGGAIPESGFINNPATATNTILIYCVWTGFGTNIILAGSAMSRIPTDIFESAKLEGCGPFREFVQMILPLIWPTMSTMIILSMTGLFTSSGPILLFTAGANKTTTLSYWIFASVYGKDTVSVNYGLVSATGLVFTLLGLPVILGVRWLFEKIPSVEY